MSSEHQNADLPTPFPSSYWVIPGLLLAGEYPGDKDPRGARQKLNSLVEAGVRHIINLIEVDETDRSGKPFAVYDRVVADLAEEVRCSVTCERRSIKDLGITDPSRMSHTLRAIDEAIQDGKPVYVHCWGGVGRTGTVIGCFLMRHGMATRENVLEVIQRLRSHDPKAKRPSPETAAQVEFVTSWLDHEDGTPTRLNRYLGCMLGGAVGDALGAPVEFMKLHEIRAKYGKSGIEDYDEAYGRIGAITDDTQMALFTAEGLLRAYARGSERGIWHPPSIVYHAYVQWLNTQGETSRSQFNESQAGSLVHLRELHSQRAPGGSCLSALAQKEMGTMDRPINDSKGCGTVMRIAPAGLFAESTEPSFDWGCEMAAITHGHPSGYLASGVLAGIIYALKSDVSLNDAIDRAIRLLKESDRHQECLNAIEQATALAAKGDPSPEALETLGGGWVAEEALAISLCCALRAEHDFAKGVLMAVNHSGDSDSTGAITGNILGCINGKSAIPSKWLDRLELEDVIETLGIDLFVKHRPDDLWRDKYPGY